MTTNYESVLYKLAPYKPLFMKDDDILSPLPMCQSSFMVNNVGMLTINAQYQLEPNKPMFMWDDVSSYLLPFYRALRTNNSTNDEYQFFNCHLMTY